MTKPPNIPEADAFDFATFLAEFGHGAPNKQASDKLQEIVHACTLTGRKGKLVLTIEVGAAGGIAELRAKISVTKPEAALPGGTYFATETGALVSEDPRQLKLPSKVLDVQPVRTITSIDGGKIQ